MRQRRRLTRQALPWSLGLFLLLVLSVPSLVDHFFFARVPVAIKAEGVPSWLRLETPLEGSASPHGPTMDAFGSYSLVVYSDTCVIPSVARYRLRDPEHQQGLASTTSHADFHIVPANDRGLAVIAFDGQSDGRASVIVDALLAPLPPKRNELPSLPGDFTCLPVNSVVASLIGLFPAQCTISVRFVETQLPGAFHYKAPMRLPREFRSTSPTPLQKLPGQEPAVASARSAVVSFSGLNARAGAGALLANVSRGKFLLPEGSVRVDGRTFLGPVLADLDSMECRAFVTTVECIEPDLDEGAERRQRFSFAVSPDARELDTSQWWRLSGHVTALAVGGPQINLRVGEKQFQIEGLDRLTAEGDLELSVTWTAPSMPELSLAGDGIESCTLNGAELVRTRWEGASPEMRGAVVGAIVAVAGSLLAVILDRELGSREGAGARDRVRFGRHTPGGRLQRVLRELRRHRTREQRSRRDQLR